MIYGIITPNKDWAKKDNIDTISQAVSVGIYCEMDGFPYKCSELFWLKMQNFVVMAYIYYRTN